ncbi:MAG: Sua5/YciO/YrdC/YwlC family protein [Gammaproteobacteria bacterium]|nr:Sua5/YciO/YrdC/YwlC family protein [Gammaproteobacteria bacterium]
MFSSQPWRYQEALCALQRGELIAYPTEAVWGLGCDPYNGAAVSHLLALKQRPVGKGLILVAAHLQQLGSLAEALDPAARARLQRETAMPTTWLLPNDGSIPGWISGAHTSVAIRISNHPIVRSLCQLYGGMLVSTSANRSGQQPARSALRARMLFGREVAAYVAGPTSGATQPSRIIDLASGRQLR